MKEFRSYLEAEFWLIDQILNEPDHITKTTHEIFGTGFVLTNPLANKNDRSNYEYAEEFFQWLLTGKKELSKRLLEINPWVQRFVDIENLPQDFSSSYGWKINEQISIILDELHINKESRRAYVNILYPGDNIILYRKTTHEYPCTIGFQLFIRDHLLNMIVNMRSNNVFSVMPYDVYNFTRLQTHIAHLINCGTGNYYHQINNAHIYKGDVRRLRESSFLNLKK